MLPGMTLLRLPPLTELQALQQGKLGCVMVTVRDGRMSKPRPAMNHELYQTARAFLIASTSYFDASHDVQHAERVMQMAFEIANATYADYDATILVLAALLHDVCDHKYTGPQSTSKPQLRNFLLEQVDAPAADSILLIIDNVSFSKQDKGLDQDLGEWLGRHLTCVRDADRLEAIGQRGLQRCMQFTEARGGEIPADVVQHCREKLLRLYNEHFIVTEYARQLALPLHQEIEQYMACH